MKERYMLGISWFILSLVISVLNDASVKYLSDNIDSVQIAFMRFGFGLLTLLPFMFYYGKPAFKTNRIWIHILRGSILFVAISIWIYNLPYVPIMQATLTTFTIPIFVLVLAYLFLGERLSKSLVFVTLIGFSAAVLSFDIGSIDFNPSALLLLVTSFLFASLDVINKKYVHKESMLSMLFYSALVTATLGGVAAYNEWITPNLNDVLVCLYLGAGSNLILFCLLKAFANVKASSTSPYRYLELIFSAILGYVIFSEVPPFTTLIGASIIIPITLYISQTRKGVH